MEMEIVCLEHSHISEHQHLEVRNSLLSYMLSIENFLVGYGEDGRYNYLQPFGHTTAKSH